MNCAAASARCGPKRAGVVGASRCRAGGVRVGRREQVRAGLVAPGEGGVGGEREVWEGCCKTAQGGIFRRVLGGGSLSRLPESSYRVGLLE